MKSARKTCLPILLLLAFWACSGEKKLVQKGEVNTSEEICSIPFDNFKGLIIIPVDINGERKQFIFDSSIPNTVLHSRADRTKKASESGKGDKKAKAFDIDSLSICAAQFKGTRGLFFDFQALELDIPGFGGLIGQSIIAKKNWLIDFEKKELKVNSTAFSHEGFVKLPVKKKGIYYYLPIVWEGKKHLAKIDLGSFNALAIPQGNELGDEIAKKFDFGSEKISAYDLGKNKDPRPSNGTIPELTFEGGFMAKAVNTTIGRVTEIGLGTELFGQGKLIIDPVEKTFWFKKKAD